MIKITAYVSKLHKNSNRPQETKRKKHDEQSQQQTCSSVYISIHISTQHLQPLNLSAGNKPAFVYVSIHTSAQHLQPLNLSAGQIVDMVKSW